MAYKNESLINTTELGRAIKRRREELGMSLRDVADATVNAVKPANHTTSDASRASKRARCTTEDTRVAMPKANNAGAMVRRLRHVERVEYRQQTKAIANTGAA